MASIRKRNAYWYIRFRDETGKQVERKASKDKGVARKMAQSIEDRITGIRMGILDPREADCQDAERRPIGDHVSDYVRNLEAKGCVAGHAAQVKRRLEWFLEETKVGRLSQIRPSLAVSALKALRDEGRGDQTVNHYCTTWKSFAKWAWRDRRTRTDLLADLELPRVVATKQRIDLPLQEVIRLIETARHGERRRGLDGPDRAMLYLVAAVSGLRRLELMSLTVESFDLDSSPATVKLPGTATKNSCDAVQPLPSSIVEGLRGWLTGKPVDGPLWNIPQNSAAMIRADLKAAGVENADHYDFHGLRHTFVSQVVAAGGSVKDSMELARHHDADLTFGRYAHSRLADLAAVVDRMPALLCPHPALAPVSAGRNGATSGLEAPCPDETAADPSGYNERCRPLITRCSETPGPRPRIRDIPTCPAWR